MQKTGLFELLSKRLVNNLVDYVFGIEAGLNSNSKKNRGGQLFAKNNLKETFDVLEDIYNIQDLEKGLFKKI